MGRRVEAWRSLTQQQDHITKLERKAFCLGSRTAVKGPSLATSRRTSMAGNGMAGSIHVAWLQVSCTRVCMCTGVQRCSCLTNAYRGQFNPAHAPIVHGLSDLEYELATWGKHGGGMLRADQSELGTLTR